MIDIEDLKARGIQLNVEGAELIIKTQQPLSAEQRNYFTRHKSEFCAALRLARLVDDESDREALLDWWASDFEIIAGLDDVQLGQLARDFFIRVYPKRNTGTCDA